MDLSLHQVICLGILDAFDFGCDQVFVGFCQVCT